VRSLSIDSQQRGFLPWFLIASLAALAIATGVLQFREVRRVRYAKMDSRLLPTKVLAPELIAPAPVGPQVQLSSLAGKIVVISFWASWCLPCRVEMPELAKLVADWNGGGKRKADIVYVAVNFKDALGEVRPLLKDPRFTGVLFACDNDGKIAERWKVGVFPTTYVISPKGEILYAQAGYNQRLSSSISAVLQDYFSDTKTEVDPR
jgi:thiol-disulfide isomerase/thioredoxin